MVKTNRNNQNRALADLVSIDAWHDEFKGGVKSVDLHADVTFGIAPMSDGPEAKIRFRLSVKKAEVVIIIPESEPAIVDPRSVARHGIPINGTHTVSQEKTISKSANASAGISTKLSSSMKADANVGASLEEKTRRTSETSQELTIFNIVQSKDADNNYRWALTNHDGTELLTKPWDAAKTPLAKIIDTRQNPAKSIHPTIRIEVRCLREDLIIEDIQITDKSITSKLRGQRNKNNMIAAETLIRKQLSEEGLEVKEISQDFSPIILASTTADALPKI